MKLTFVLKLTKASWLRACGTATLTELHFPRAERSDGGAVGFAHAHWREGGGA